MGGFRQEIESAIPALRRYARALTRNVELADDLVQDTLVRALRSEHLFHGGDIRSWLYTILTNLNRNRLRSIARRPLIKLISDSALSGLQLGLGSLDHRPAGWVGGTAITSRPDRSPFAVAWSNSTQSIADANSK